jgi:hypothetical protein
MKILTKIIETQLVVRWYQHFELENVMKFIPDIYLNSLQLFPVL